MTEKRPRGRPKDASKRAALLDAARSLFLKHGPDVSMDDIAAAAMVAKATLYANFSDKNNLMEEVIRRESDLTITDEEYLSLQGEHIEDALRTFGRKYVKFVNSKDLFGWDSLFAHIAMRHPELPQRFFELGPGRGQRLLKELIANAMHKGHLKPADPDEAADTLCGMWLGFANLEIKLGIRPQLCEDEISKRVDRGIGIFMIVYGK